MKLMKSFECYLENLMDEFTYEDFDPENQEKLYDRLKKVFFKNTPFWKNIGNERDFEIEFKKYGDNRKRIVLIFTVKSRHLELTLCEINASNREDNITQEISFAGIWLDHSKLFDGLKEIMLKGLEKAAKCNAG